MDPKVNEVVQAMNELVAKDGGQLRVLEYDLARTSLSVEYRLGVNDECPTCLITPEIMHDFLLEGLRSHEVPVSTVEVVTS